MSKFKEYIKELQGMERITLILDLLVDKKITKEEAVVLIANDKQMKDTTKVDLTQWVQNPYSSTITIPSSYTSAGTTTTVGSIYDTSISTNA